MGNFYGTLILVLLGVVGETELTLLDVAKLIRHYWKASLLIIAICLVAGCGFGLLKGGLKGEQYSAEAVLTISEPTATVSASELIPLAQAMAANVISDFDSGDAEVSEECNLSQRAMTFSAVASTEEAAVEAVNGAAQQTAAEMSALLGQMADGYRSSREGEDAPKDTVFLWPYGDEAAALELVSFTVNEASIGVSSRQASSLLKFSVAGFALGFFLVVGFAIVVDLAKRPIKGRDDLENVSNAPVLAEESSTEFGSRLWANIQFAMGGVPASICLVPVGSASADQVGRQLEKAISTASQEAAEPISITTATTFTESVEGVLCAHEAAATIIVVEQWSDSHNRVLDVTRELGLAQANFLGSVLMSGR